MNRNQSIFLIVGFLVYSFLQKTRSNIPVYFVSWLPFGFNGLTLPPFGIFIHKDHKENENLLLHELVHWRQFQSQGLFLFLLNYSKETLKNGYDGNKYEIEA